MKKEKRICQESLEAGGRETGRRNERDRTREKQSKVKERKTHDRKRFGPKGQVISLSIAMDFSGEWHISWGGVAHPSGE